MFPADLERDAFRSGDEFGWTREQAIAAIEVLRRHDLAILGGELWYVEDGLIQPSVPQRQGPNALHVWDTERQPGEIWANFVQRGAYDALTRVESWPEPESVPPDLPGRILYNLTWVSESEFEELKSRCGESPAKTQPWWKFWI
jgi:hypothetical protein